MTTRPDFLCPHCSEPLHHPGGHADHSVRCPGCGATVEVPEYGLSHLNVPAEPAAGQSPWQLDVAPPAPEHPAVVDSPPARERGRPARSGVPNEHPAVADSPPGRAPQPRPRRAVGSAVLLSYAVAMTWIALWFWWNQHTGLEHLPDHGNRGDETRIVAPATPVPRGQLVPLGQSITVGDLRVTPLDVRRGRVVLERSTEDGAIDRQVAGSDSLILRLRLTNLSKDQAFYPLDESLLRAPPQYAYSYIERSDGAKIMMYPLALDSDFHIQGEHLVRLDPDQTIETIVAAEEGSAGRARGAMVWRLHLRTAARVRPDGTLEKTTTVVGVPFTAGQVHGERGD